MANFNLILGLNKEEFEPTFGEKLEKVCTRMVGIYALALVLFVLYAAPGLILFTFKDCYTFVRYPAIELQWLSQL